MKRIVIAALTLSLIVATGCLSKNPQLNVAAAYPFEGRYGPETEIKIDGKRIAYSESVWVLSNKTLYSILTTSNAGKRRDPIFLDNRFGLNPISYEAPAIWRGDIEDFATEEYVWENWTVSTNAVGF